jgi:hypothetical protein
MAVETLEAYPHYLVVIIGCNSVDMYNQDSELHSKHHDYYFRRVEQSQPQP